MKYAEQQRILGRYKRSPAGRNKRLIVHDKQLEPLEMKLGRDNLDIGNSRQEKVVSVKEMGIEFNDPQFPRMWYLVSAAQEP